MNLPLDRWSYRARQFRKAWAGGLTPAERAEVARVLAAPLATLFHGMRPEAQRHAFDVYTTLCRAGWTDPDLLAAALLHDVAKGRLNPLHRAAWVVAGAVSPRVRAWVAVHTPLGVWLGLRTNHQHAAAGAEILAQAGARPQVVRLVREHYQNAADDPLLRALQQADDQN